jgi:hypothetical protein
MMIGYVAVSPIETDKRNEAVRTWQQTDRSIDRELASSVSLSPLSTATGTGSLRMLSSVIVCAS